MTAFPTFISPAALAAHRDDSAWVIVDCRNDLFDLGRGRREYLSAHIPGALHADLAKDLSGPVTGATGRHPLPDMDEFVARLSAWGVDAGKQVVAYDESDGSMAAARLWWMLRYLGHEAVAVLDGGFDRWRSEGYPVREGSESARQSHFVPHPHPELLATAEDVERRGAIPGHVLVDSRIAERYRGEVEPIDKVAGRIPGAVNRFHRLNVTERGILRPAGELRAEFDQLLAGTPPENAVVYCGSGVTSCQNLLVLEHLGLTGARLYVGSWSEWSADPHRPVAKGDPE